ncbi:MAG TPA: bifunctional 3,4-dihydroxy-2-butanone-4-phosphate synthase/GTP cyclohydrolase II [Accumulibacter sp.]|jgi:3,4-dihydroxy 2-butanone 4-phosphate synthase/GTP cyclohydrolase II|nr:bifunctional 3,4-dihydroxy-2-butanone-4-phosphate synthase/GTP cyclohydrolase II [Accumulibacter sp.]
MAPQSTSADVSPIEEIIVEMRAGRMVVLVDEEDRENEGDLVLAAEHVSAEAINFMARHGRGLICLTLSEARCRQLGLMQMARDNKSPYSTAFTVSIEAAEGVTTGISAQDRARTIKAAVARNAGPNDIVQPGHVFPIMARPGGVLVRAGHTEAGCDLAQLAGLEPAAVICEILKDDGSMARLEDLVGFAREHNLKIGSIADLIHYRSRHEALVERTFSKPVRTAHGELTLHAYTDRTSNEVHLVLTKGDIRADRETLVRVHEPLSVVDFIDLEGGRHTFPLSVAMAALTRVEAGVIVLLHRPESGQDILDLLREPAAAKRPAARWDPRIYGIGAQILRDLGVGKMKLLSSPRRMPSMTGFDLEVTGHIATPADLDDIR